MKTLKQTSYYLMVIAYIVILFALLSCEKDEQVKPAIPQTDYDITYFVKCDSAFVEYNVGAESHKRYVNNWDTSFSTQGDWTINVMVYGFSKPFLSGLIINNDTVDGCRGGDYCLMGLYLKP